MVEGQKIGTNRARLYADLYIDETSKPEMIFSDSNVDCIVVCTRTDFFVSWAQIEKELSKYLRKTIVLRSFQLNRALFLSTNRNEAEIIGNYGLRFFDRGIAVKMEKWVEERHSYFGVIASYGG